MSAVSRRGPRSRHRLLPQDKVVQGAIRLPVAGLTPMTTLDYPGHLACVVFLQGCPLRCGYCHNPQMLESRRAKASEWAEIETFLTNRRGLLEGVVFSGGEPTLHPELPDAVSAARAMGFKVGLHTSGVYPRRLAELLAHLDWVGLDVKGLNVRGSVDHFDTIVGRPGLASAHADSLAMLLESNVDLECRTTLHWRDFTLDSLHRLALSLARRGVKHYALQVARTDQCLDPGYSGPQPGTPAPTELRALVDELAPAFDTLVLRE